MSGLDLTGSSRIALISAVLDVLAVEQEVTPTLREIFGRDFTAEDIDSSKGGMRKAVEDGTLTGQTLTCN
jgi:hypothetical protein